MQLHTEPMASASVQFGRERRQPHDVRGHTEKDVLGWAMDEPGNQNCYVRVLIFFLQILRKPMYVQLAI